VVENPVSVAHQLAILLLPRSVPPGDEQIA
jgi:hypothetical protein